MNQSNTMNGLKPELPENTSIKIIGLGGVGSIVARYLSIFLAAQQKEYRLVLIDGDSFEPGNATRMIFGSQGNKAEVIRDELLPRFQDSKLSIVAVPEYIKDSNKEMLIKNEDIVFLCVDNHRTRQLINDHLQNLCEIHLFSGGNDGVDGKRRGTYGTVQFYQRNFFWDGTPSLTKYHPEIANPTDKHPEDKSCTELVVSTPQILFANLAVASAMLNTFFLHCCGALNYCELAFDIAEGRMRPTMPLKGL